MLAPQTVPSVSGGRQVPSWVGVAPTQALPNPHSCRSEHTPPSASGPAMAHRWEIGSHAVQLLGGHGFVKEFDNERWYRDLRGAGVLEGTLLV